MFERMGEQIVASKRHPSPERNVTDTLRVLGYKPPVPNPDKLTEFTAWCMKHITGDEKGQAQIFLDRLFQAFGQSGCLDVGGSTEFRIRKADEDGGGTAFADYVWKPVVLIEMKKRGTDLQKHYRQAFDYWTRFTRKRGKSRGGSLFLN